MEMSLQTLLSWQFILFCLGIAALTSVVRKVVEFILDNPKVPASKTSKFWTELFLPILPIILGLVMAVMAKKFPYPMDASSALVRGLFGSVAGLLSGLVYRILAGMLRAKLPVNEKNDNNINLVPSNDMVDNVNATNDANTVVSDEELKKLAQQVKQTIKQ